MIDQALLFLSSFLNKEIRLSFGIDEDKVILSSLNDLGGTLSAATNNRLILSLINLEHITSLSNQGGRSGLSAGGFEKKSPPVNMNLYILLAANYDTSGYMEGLKMLSSSIGIFQATNVFERSGNPQMDASLDKLSLEIVNVPLKELSSLWSGVGTKYMPSILYKVRLVTIEKNKIDGIIPEITGLGTSATKNE